ncbi:MAG: MFS transporter [Caldilineaceae bacterium]|nr:MFS transporter [Caldilineaceae bacterium]
MMADSIEHVITYWIIYQRYQSPTLAGFAVIAHWVPFLVFSVYVGALADRFDPRRLIQIGLVLFMVASLGWAALILTDELRQWHAALLLVVHGLAGVFWAPVGQVLLHDIVKPAQLPSAVRLMATSRFLGLLLGPAVGSLLLVAVGPWGGLLINVLIYVPLFVWLIAAPYGPKFREGGDTPRNAVRGFADVWDTMRAVAGMPVILSMICLAGAASFFIGSAYQVQMPAYAAGLGAANDSVSYGLLLIANASGAMVGGIILEWRGLLPPRPRTAFVLVGLWALTLGGFAFTTNFYVGLVLLFIAGFLFLAYGAMTQALVQIHAPPEIRGRVIGLYSMSALGLMTFSGITIGIGGSYVGVHWSLGASAMALLVFTMVLAPVTLRARTAVARET